MSSITQKLKDFAHSKRGQDTVHKAQEYATKPENKEKIEQVRDKVTGKGRHSHEH
jgi:hypothetical protein